MHFPCLLVPESGEWGFASFWMRRFCVMRLSRKSVRDNLDILHMRPKQSWRGVVSLYQQQLVESSNSQSPHQTIQKWERGFLLPLWTSYVNWFLQFSLTASLCSHRVKVRLKMPITHNAPCGRSSLLPMAFESILAVVVHLSRTRSEFALHAGTQVDDDD